MDAVKYIEDNLNPLTILEYYGFKEISETDDSIRACCRIHNGNNPSGFVWKKENNLWYCYSGECHGGDVFNLIQKIEGVDFVTSVNKAATILDLNINNMSISLPDTKIKKEQLRWLQKQSKKIVSNNEYKLPYTKYQDELSTFTRFDTETIRFYDAKFCSLFPTENAMLKNKLVIPVYDKGKCIAAALRDTTGHFIPKWLYQPKGVKLSMVLYNLDLALQQDTDEIILVEGIFDVWAYHNAGIDSVAAVFGSSVSEEQYKTLLRTGRNIVMSFDSDDAGKKCTRKTAEKFMNKTELLFIELPQGKDPADCTKEELLNAYLKRTKYVQE